MFRRCLVWGMLIACGMFGNGLDVSAQDTEEKLKAVHEMKTVTVIGSKEAVLELPGSGAYVDAGEIRDRNYDDVNEVLRRIPGVYVREEDGFGLFPNISLRGVAPGRSEKVTIMEDGLLMAPAPYSAPAAYYSPKVGRMSGLEVIKGSSQIQYGPHTSGGVINYLSTPIPKDLTLYFKSSGGSFGDRKVHTYLGETSETSMGDIGTFFELYYRGSDGFKSLDRTSDGSGEDDTGFDLYEPMMKLSWEPQWDLPQRFEFKFGFSYLDANETYLGLTDEDFKDNPYRRYAGSRFDNILSEHYRTSLRHDIELTDDLNIATTLYFNYFHRDWFKLNGDGEDLLNPTTQAIWKGQAAGTLTYRHNNRHYYTGGVQSILDYYIDIGAVEHHVNAGFRYNNDRIRRDQENVNFTQDANGNITNVMEAGQGSGGDRLQITDAFAFHFQDAMSYGDWTVTPGIRYEHLEQSYKDFNAGDSGTGDMDVVSPGIGLNYDVNEDLSLFGGVYRGVSVPGPRDHIRNGIDEETSLGYEIGSRYHDGRGLDSELVFFYTDFDDLIVSDNIGGGGSGDTDNAGDIITMGAEFKIVFDPGQRYGWGIRNPYSMALTYTHAELDGDANSDDTESIFAGGQDGHKVPYVPEYQITVGTGLETDRWGVYVDATIVDETFTTASNTGEQVNASTGTPDARFGKTDQYYTIDISAHYYVRDDFKIFANAQNVTDEDYIVSRHPIGPRPGRPFTMTAGVELTF